MTQITVFKEKGKIWGFECKGHSGYAESGADIICAAISTLAGSCHLGISKILGLAHTFEIDENKGYFKLMLKPESAQNQSAQVLLQTFAQSAEELADSHKKFIKLKQEG